MNISEIFHSLQGEGFLAGVPSTFIRLAGCPLRCRWCDTKYAWSDAAGDELTIPAILETVAKLPTRHVVITGGEPLLAPQLPELTSALTTLDKHITIETAGIAHSPNVSCDLMSISPKLGNSTPVDPQLAEIHEPARLDIAVLQLLTDSYDYQLKFVVDSPADLAEIERLLADIEHIDRRKVMLMPHAATREELLERAPMVADLCKSAGLTFCHRFQVMLWDNQRAT